MAQRTIKVNAGETYMDIAKRELGDVTQAKTLQKNNPGRLRAGMEITLPDNTVTNPTVQAPGTTPPMTPMKTETPVATGAPMTPTPPVPVTAPPLSMSGQAPTPVIRDPNAPALSVSGQAPVYDPRTTATNPNGIGAPNVGRTMYQGGKQTFDIFEKMKSGVVAPNQTPVTPAEKEAVAMYQNYQKYQNADAQTLLGAIQSGELTPDKTNLLWRALGQNGEPTDAMIQAYAMWDKGIKAGADGKRSQDPFLGGAWQTIQSEAEANTMINDFSGEDNTVDGEVVSSTDGGTSTSTGTVTKGTSEYDMYRQTLLDITTQPTIGGSDYQGKLSDLRGKYNIQQDEQGLQSLDDEAMAIENDLVARRNQARSQPVAMGVIAGRVGEIERQQMERLNQVNRDRQYLANSLAQKQSIIGSFMEAYGMDYESAREDFDTRYNRSLQAIDMFRTIRKDEVAEQSAIASAELAQKKYEDEKSQQRKDDAKAKLDVIYGAIGDGTMDPALMKAPAMAIQMAQLEIEAGYPIGTFTGMMDKNPDKTYRTTIESVNAKGERIVTAMFTDKNTGEPSFYKQNLGVDAKLLLDIEKGVYDVEKAKNESEMFPIEKQLKQQQLNNSILTGQKTFQDIMKDTTAVASDFINPENSKYGIAIATDGSLIVNVQKNDKGEYKTLPGREQCGEFVNDVLGLTGENRVGDTIEDKKRLISSSVPIVGGAFIQATKGATAKNGHIGIVTKTYPDGSFDYINANEAGKNDGSITVGRMTAEDARNNGVLGFTQGYNNVKNPEATKMTEGERKEAATKDLRTKTSTALSTNAGDDGYVSPEVYRAVKKQWAINGDPKEFDKLYKDYINPTHYGDYGVDVLDDTTKSYFESESSYTTKKAEEANQKKQAEETNVENERLKEKYMNIDNERLKKLQYSAKTSQESNEITKEMKRRGL